jgi:hypothetical protein
MAVLLMSTGAAAADQTSQVRARLVADTDRLVPAGSLQIGVLLEMAPGWHVYWRNPGDAGLATEVRLALPQGFEAGHLRWPAPLRFVQPGNLIGYGYEGSALLAAEVAVPRDLLLDDLMFAADVSWLACREVCVLGSASLVESWPLPVADVAFERWRRELPGDDPPFEVSVTGGVEPGSRQGVLSLWLQWPDPPGDVGFFPADAEAVKVSDVRVQTRGSLTRIDCSARLLESGSERPTGFAAVVAAGNAAEARSSWKILVPIGDALNTQ